MHNEAFISRQTLPHCLHPASISIFPLCAHIHQTLTRSRNYSRLSSAGEGGGGQTERQSVGTEKLL